MVYLLHFDRPLAHAQHYVGFTDDLDTRLAQHRRADRNTHHRLMVVIAEKGITFRLARVWHSEDRIFERRIKRYKNGRALCPICAGAGALRRLP